MTDTPQQPARVQIDGVDHTPEAAVLRLQAETQIRNVVQSVVAQHGGGILSVIRTIVDDVERWWGEQQAHAASVPPPGEQTTP
jgi:hypothetical protein